MFLRFTPPFEEVRLRCQAGEFGTSVVLWLFIRAAFELFLSRGNRPVLFRTGLHDKSIQVMRFHAGAKR